MTDPPASPRTGPTASPDGRSAGTAANGNGHRQRRVWLLHACGFTLLIAALAATVAMARRSGDADAWVARTLEVRRATGALFDVLQESEASVRAYLLLGDPSVLTRYEAARASLGVAEARLRELISDNPQRTARLDALQPTIDQRLAVLAETVDIARSGDQPALGQRLRQREGTKLMDHVRDELADLDQSEAELLVQREATARDARRQLLAGSSGALSLALLLGAFTTLLTQRQARALRASNVQLTETVIDRTGALRSSEARFRQVFQVSPIGLTIATADTRHIIAANPAACSMFGYTEDEFIGRTSHDFVHPDDADLIVPAHSLSELSARPIEARYITRGGSVLHARVSVVRLSLPGEAETLVLGTMADVTHEREVEAALRDSETQLRLAIEVAGLGLCELDLARGVTRFDRSAEGITQGMVPANVWLEIDGAELAGWRAMIHSDDAAAHAAARAALHEGHGDRHAIEYRVRRRDGSLSWISAVSTIVERQADTNRALRVLTVLQDITQRKATESELRHAQRIEALGQLTGGVAHDFNNLLGAILGHAEFLLETLPDGSEERDLAREIVDCTLGGASLTQRLLAFARRQPLQPAVIDLNEYLPVHVSLLQRTIGGTITVEVELAPDLWLTHADPSQIIDVLLNLAINARDAMPHGGVLTIATANVVLDASDRARHPEAVEGEYVALSVRDTGTGMAPEVLVRAIEPFFTTKPPGRGTGLGLSTIYGFARQSGGHLRIDSVPGEGTTVRLFLPRSHGERMRVAGQPPQPEPPLPGGSEAILLVDDNESMRATTARNLTSLGYHVRLAADGPEALEILQGGEHFDLLFTDLVMPNGLNGYQLAETARSLLPDLRVLLTTGFAPENGNGAEVLNGNVLRKPYQRRELAIRIRAVLDADG